MRMPDLKPRARRMRWTARGETAQESRRRRPTAPWRVPSLRTHNRAAMQDVSGSDVGKVESAIVEGAPQIRLIGECDMATAPALQELVDTLIARGQIRIVFDLQQVTFLDSSVLRIFLNARRDAIPLGGEVVLLCRPGFVRRLLTLLEMDRLLRICTPEEWRQHVAALN